MSQPKDIFNKVFSILNSDTVLSSYVEKIYERYRDDLDRSKRVVIMVEPTDVIEKVPGFPLEVVFVIIITGYFFESDPDKSINDGSARTIMDLEQDIKDALRPYYDLDGLCNNFTFTKYFRISLFIWFACNTNHSRSIHFWRVS